MSLQLRKLMNIYRIPLLIVLSWLRVRLTFLSFLRFIIWNAVVFLYVHNTLSVGSTNAWIFKYLYSDGEKNYNLHNESYCGNLPPLYNVQYRGNFSLRLCLYWFCIMYLNVLNFKLCIQIDLVICYCYFFNLESYSCQLQKTINGNPRGFNNEVREIGLSKNETSFWILAQNKLLLDFKRCV